ncbi:lipid-A-disaccharide synthase-like uncharacterized protein [Labrys wisconsinensis]|uniref:Lipid-A-disaccharide synthase-like uncharacterized protein n=1 Tax=Labrys wisconsinensis TaxID=425677 RepID=A0ABU0J3Y6_9HYPH|nr:lipid-A-disaccharide synthase N-terminal domain-containing protein [Labrys wisconsinensis]MDQ0468330.1 lipid-A-disaccharide synthase-like uncharacterized protein [Labrys wisconsinensis]
MLVDISNAVGGYLHLVFIDKFNGWVVLGLVAQVLFTMRFVVQWLASERAGRSVVPFSFWSFSIGGGALLLLYAIKQQDPVYILGQLFSLFVYFRNVSFVLKERRANRASGGA